MHKYTYIHIDIHTWTRPTSSTCHKLSIKSFTHLNACISWCVFAFPRIHIRLTYQLIHIHFFQPSYLPTFTYAYLPISILTFQIYLCLPKNLPFQYTSAYLSVPPTYLPTCVPFQSTYLLWVPLHRTCLASNSTCLSTYSLFSPYYLRTFLPL